MLLFLTWSVLGLTCGYLAGKLVRDDGVQLMLDLALGTVGAVLAGMAFANFGTVSSNPFLHGAFAALAGASVTLLVHHLLVRTMR